MPMPQAGMTFHLPFATPSQNAYQRWHWRRRAKLRDAICWHLRLQVRKAKAAWVPLARVKMRMGMDLIRYGARELDYGNLVGGAKAACDALVLEGLLYDDSPRWLCDTYQQVKAAKAHEKTVIVLYPV